MVNADKNLTDTLCETLATLRGNNQKRLNAMGITPPTSHPKKATHDAFEEIRCYDAKQWVFERSSGYSGYRNTSTNEWKYEHEIHNLQLKKSMLEQRFKLLHDFRGECLPFGEYPDVVLWEFLKNQMNLS